MVRLCKKYMYCLYFCYYSSKFLDFIHIFYIWNYSLFFDENIRSLMCIVFFKNLRIFLAISALVTFCNGYKLLVLAPMNGKSHFLYIQSFVRAMLERGHEVTYLTSNSLNHLKLTNYTEVLIESPFDMSAGDYEYNA